MSYEVYKADFSNRHEITHAIGIQMTRHYNAIGKMMIVLPIDDYNIDAIDINSLIYDTDSGESYTVQNIKKDSATNRMTVNGYTSNWLLNKRILSTKRELTTVETDVYAAISDNLRDLPRLSLATAKGLQATTDAVIEPGALLDVVIPILESAEYGHRMVWNPDTMQHTFEIYQGDDLTQGIHAVVFSEEQGTAAKLIITDDNSTLKNFFYIPGKLRNDTEIVETFGDATAGERYEWWIKGSQTQKDDETEAQFRQRLKSECAAEAAQRLRRTTFSVDIDSSELGRFYKLGDKISCASLRFGVEFYARITGITYKMDALGSSTSLTLGEPQLTALGEVKLG